MDKHSSLLQKSVNCGRKKFYNIGPWFQKVKNVTKIKEKVLLAT